MKGCRRYKRCIAQIRSHHARRTGAKNGSLGFIDDPWLDKLLYNSKRRYRRPNAKGWWNLGSLSWE